LRHAEILNMQKCQHSKHACWLSNMQDILPPCWHAFFWNMHVLSVTCQKNACQHTAPCFDVHIAQHYSLRMMKTLQAFLSALPMCNSETTLDKVSRWTGTRWWYKCHIMKTIIECVKERVMLGGNPGENVVASDSCFDHWRVLFWRMDHWQWQGRHGAGVPEVRDLEKHW